MKHPVFAVALVLASTCTALAQSVPSRSSVLTPSFRAAAQVAFDAIEAAELSDRGSELVYALQQAKARDELNRVKREVRSKADAVAAVKLLSYFNEIDLCRLQRQAGSDSSDECHETDRRNDAIAAIGARTWKEVRAMAEH